MEPTLIWILVSVLGGFVLALLLGRVLVPALRALKAGQSIREVGPKWHQGKAGTPTMGGIVFILSSLLCIVTGWYAMRETGDYKHLFVLALALMFGLIGFADDFIKVKKKRNLGLTGLQKLVLQVLAACLFLAGMHFTHALTYDLYIPFVREPLVHIPPLVYLALSVFIIVGCVNAVNLTDGVDGLSSSVTIPVMVFFAATAYIYGRTTLALLPATVAGGLAAFLCYNFHPAKVFMGDTGSLFLGGMVCGMAFALDMPLILILVGIIYICETLSVISGSAAAVISARVLLLSKSGSEIFITLLLSAVVSGVTVGGKACGKSLAMNSSTAVVRTAAKVLCFFRTLPQRLEKKSAKK